MSAVILWCEIVMGVSANLSPLGALLGEVTKGDHVAFQLMALLPLAYMTLCTFRTLFKFRLISQFYLTPARSSAGSLLFNAQYLVRLQFPLCVNYLLLLRYEGSEGSAFRRLM